jgi:adenine-specific DNA-methyltransferase
MPPRKKKTSTPAQANDYRHAEQALARPDVGTQPQFKKRAAPKTYRYDSSLAPALDWDGQNAAREQGEALIREILEAETVEAAKAAAAKLKALSKPFLAWAGKAERLSFDVPTLPLYIHERLSTRAILETLKGHRADKQLSLFELFADPQRPIHEQVLRAYEYTDDWVNRMILGDSLVVMNSLLHYESLGGQVQMIYMDPPYGVRFGSNFQPFVRKRDVAHNDDEDMTREPEMVQAYRDTWELGLHSYLTYLRDRLLLCRDLLAPSGSVFVQISDENLHHLRELMDEVFGVQNFVVTLLVKKKGSQKSEILDPVNDYVVWFAKDKSLARERFNPLFEPVDLDEDVARDYKYAELPDGRELTLRELSNLSKKEVDYAARPDLVVRDFPKAKLFAPNPLTSGGYRRTQSVKFTFNGRTFDPGIEQGNCWKHSAISDDGSPSGMERLAAAGRLFAGEGQLRFKRYLSDFGYKPMSNWWDRLGGAANPIYVVQTNAEIVQRCVLMTTRPGDLVLDPTCGSGTTAYVAERWGRRWITIDTSRVPLALARQRLLTATFPWYELKDESPAAGFIYRRRQNANGEEVGGIVPHITSSMIANDEPPVEEVLVDRPEEAKGITRVTGPFVFEATIPTVSSLEEAGAQPEAPVSLPAQEESDFIDRMIEVLRHSPALRLEGNRTLTLRNVRRPAKTLSLSAEAVVSQAPNGKPGAERPVALVFGPENGAVAERLVWEAAREAHAKRYVHLYVIGFAIQPTARQLVESCEAAIGIPATYVQATPDLMMGDLLKNMRSSQIFSVCGLPEVAVRKAKPPAHETSKERRAADWYEVELLGLDVFDPATMQVDHRRGDDVPAWFLDTDYNGQSFHVCQAFFPRTAAWDSLKRALKGEYEDSVWQHLAGTVSVPFEPGQHGQIAVKVIDDRGNELMVVKALEKGK